MANVFSETSTPIVSFITGPENNVSGDSGDLAGNIADISLSSVSFGDIDGDGLIDMLVGNTREKSSLRYLKNTGSTTNPQFTEQDSTSSPFVNINGAGFTDTNGSITNPGAFGSLVDIEGDGDLDLFLGGSLGNIYFYENDGSNVFAATQTGDTTGSNTLFTGIDIDASNSTNFYTAPVFTDIDGDGDEDLFIGKYDGTVDYYRNDLDPSIVSPTLTDIVFVQDNASANNPFSSLSSQAGNNRVVPGFAEVKEDDGTIHYDAYLGKEDGTIDYYFNDGSNNFTLVAATDSSNPFLAFNSADPNSTGRSAPAFADFDSDGEVEAFVGSRTTAVLDSSVMYFENNVSDTLLHVGGGLFSFGNTANGSNLAIQISSNGASQITNANLTFSDSATTKSLFSVLPSSFHPSAFASDSSLTQRTFILEDTTFRQGADFTVSFDIFNNGSFSTVSSSQVTGVETTSGSGVWTLSVDSDANGSTDLQFSVFQTNDLPDTNGLGTGTGTATTQLNGGSEIVELSAAATGSFTLYREAAFNNTVGLYKIDDATGAVGGVAPGASGYAQAAIAARVSGADLSVGDQQSTTVSGVSFEAGLYAPFMIVDSTVENYLSNGGTAYFTYTEANSDGTDHILLLGNNLFGFEDLAGGGDFDYNDLIVQVDFA